MNLPGLKVKTNRNPVYEKGFQAGVEAGAEVGREVAIQEFTDKFYTFLTEGMESLTDVKGIGEVTADKVRIHLLEYMARVTQGEED